MQLYELFDEYLENLHSSNNYKYTVTRTIQKIKFYFCNCDILEVKTQKIQEFVNYMYYIEQLKDTTVYNTYKIVRVIFNYAIRKEYLEKNPCDGVSIKRVHYAKRQLDYSKKFLRKLLKAFKKTDFYEFVYLDLHTRFAKRRNVSIRYKQKHYL